MPMNKRHKWYIDIIMGRYKTIHLMRPNGIFRKWRSYCGKKLPIHKFSKDVYVPEFDTELGKASLLNRGKTVPFEKRGKLTSTTNFPENATCDECLIQHEKEHYDEIHLE